MDYLYELLALFLRVRNRRGGWGGRGRVRQPAGAPCPVPGVAVPPAWSWNLATASTAAVPGWFSSSLLIEPILPFPFPHAPHHIHAILPVEN